jgi:hypothetical protein
MNMAAATCLILAFRFTPAHQEARERRSHALAQKNSPISFALPAAPGKLLSPSAFITVFSMFWC